jgi:hypothetical protein
MPYTLGGILDTSSEDMTMQSQLLLGPSKTKAGQDNTFLQQQNENNCQEISN